MEEPSPFPEPVFTAGDAVSEESQDGVVWRVERDVLARTTACVIDHGSEYDAPYGTVVEHYGGRVSVDTRTFEQRAESDVSFTVRYPDAGVAGITVRATMDMTAGPDSYDVAIELECREGDDEVARRTWARTFPRRR